MSIRSTWRVGTARCPNTGKRRKIRWTPTLYLRTQATRRVIQIRRLTKPDCSGSKEIKRLTPNAVAQQNESVHVASLAIDESQQRRFAASIRNRSLDWHCIARAA